MQQTAGMRRPGAAALDLAYVAAGRIDGFWEIGLKPWDTAAGTLLITEAGGRVGTLTGGEYKQGGNIIAGTPKVYEAMVECLGPLRARGAARGLRPALSPPASPLGYIPPAPGQAHKTSTNGRGGLHGTQPVLDETHRQLHDVSRPTS